MVRHRRPIATRGGLILLSFPAHAVSEEESRAQGLIGEYGERKSEGNIWRAERLNHVIDKISPPTDGALDAVRQEFLIQCVKREVKATHRLDGFVE